MLDRIVLERGRGPELLRSDNGPELTSNALRDWCQLGKTGSVFIEPGSPWQNPFVESFGSRVRDEVLAVEAFSRRLPFADTAPLTDDTTSASSEFLSFRPRVQSRRRIR